MSDQEGQFGGPPVGTAIGHLDDFPAMATKVGEVSAWWAQLEQTLYYIFEIVLGAPSACAAAAFGAVESNRGRRELLGAVAAEVLPEAHLKTLDDLLRRVKSSAAQRNQLIHDMFLVVPSGPTQPNSAWVGQLRRKRVAGYGRVEEVRASDIDAIKSQIVKLAEDAHAFKLKIEPVVLPILAKARAVPGAAIRFVPKGHHEGQIKKGQGKRPLPPAAR